MMYSVMSSTMQLAYTHRRVLDHTCTYHYKLMFSGNYKDVTESTAMYRVITINLAIAYLIIDRVA
jgi:hypothetical protein